MRCEKAKRHLALLARNELGRGKGGGLFKHLETCRDCQGELDEYKRVLSSLKAAARQEERDWEESDWQSLMGEIKAIKTKPGTSVFIPRLKLAWAYGLLMLLALGLGVGTIKGILQKRGLARHQASLILTPADQNRPLDRQEISGLNRFNDRPFSAREEKLKPARTEPAALSAGLQEKASQDRLSLVLVSQETGLQVYWTFDKNFDWKEEQP